MKIKSVFDRKEKLAKRTTSSCIRRVIEKKLIIIIIIRKMVPSILYCFVFAGYSSYGRKRCSYSAFRHCSILMAFMLLQIKNQLRLHFCARFRFFAAVTSNYIAIAGIKRTNSTAKINRMLVVFHLVSKSASTASFALGEIEHKGFMKIYFPNKARNKL